MLGFVLFLSELPEGGFRGPGALQLIAYDEGGLSCPHPVSLFSSSNSDEAQEAEAIQILTSILNFRESTSDKAPQKTVFVLKTLVMLYYQMMNASKVNFPRKEVY